MAVPILLALGLAAGALTTLAGQGGGLFLLLCLSAWLGPHAALAMTTPALLMGNVHRAWLSRRAIDWPIAGRFLIGAVPGSVVGGLFAGLSPAWLVRVFLIAMTVLAVVKAVRGIRAALPRRLMPLAGGAVGALTGTSGGAGVLISPIFLAAGLTGATYIGTQSVVASAIHAGRLVAYGSTGLLAGIDVGGVLALTVAIFAGNVVADRLRRRLPAVWATRVEYATLLVCTTLAVLGLKA
ncbi:MAG: sulfite exporter TauE/SafE family protein [Myxococcales bacterium]|nr:sulfite exporter TauE/SafE family protein [Myxococcales bacterium]